ncbi:sce7726 family protein [Mesorhizobium sp. B2-5-9]|uniref:sce7726 family protein n=1 Tax=unclassified Mesorhizobium TaxID=325217 RepID=UPI00112D84DD|nr:MULTISPECIES: sce7726 family protein [unclassified Mesorhizobium]TPK20791.1 sce7726 family protein [Mesorhizobium sp. B2-5-9]TPK78864.1 sce7726 family protein [Mesorhizobium sp. B2-4-18]
MDRSTKIAPLTRDADIRIPLIGWLRSQHPDDGSTGFVEEFKMPKPSARIDVAVVNGELAGFEIKSDRDSLSRLTSQVPAFSRFFDKVSLVTTAKHHASARMKIPLWWGIILYGEGTSFQIARTPKQNRSVDIRSLLFALSKGEISDLGRLAGCRISTSDKKSLMVEKAEAAICEQEIRDHARDLIRGRSRQPMVHRCRS